MARPQRRKDRQSARRGRGALAAAACLFAVAVLVSCGHTGMGRGASSERQSESEYDVARDLFLSRRDPRGALEHAQKAVELNGDNAEAHHLIALLYLYFCAGTPPDCRLSEAERAARKAVAVRSDFREAENTLGVILVQEKRYDEAIAVLTPLANDILYQTPWDAWGNLGSALLEQGKVDQAIEALRRSVAAEPRFCVGNFRLGLAYEKKGDMVAAREALTRALETNRPECQSLQDAFEVRGRVLAKLKSCDLARGDWERCKQIRADSPVGVRCAANLSAPC